MVRAVVAGQIANQGVTKGVENIAAQGMTVVFGEHVDGIITAWRKPLSKAAATLTRCHDRIGNVPLEDTHTFLRQGDDVARVWADAREAVTTIDRFGRAWIALANLTKFVSIDPRFPGLRIASATAEQWDAAGLNRATPDA